MTHTRRVLAICLLLAAATLAAYWPVLRHDFINYDDPEYVSRNPQVLAGLTAPGVTWTFTTQHTGNWHPLTWLSHMLDAQLFGLRPGGHHLTGLLLHAANALLLFLALRGLTGAPGRSAVVAALFALHPLHVESVAWVSERKDVLSAFFGLLTLLAYLAYAKKVESRKQKAGTNNRAWGWYGLALGLFALGLLSKPMLVTLPFVLLLLDFWPLQRLELSTLNSQPSTLRWLVLEKVPFFLLAAASCAVTLVAQGHGNAIAAVAEVPVELRLQNALVSYAVYLLKMLWPTHLAVYYPLPDAIPPGQTALAVLLLMGLSVVAIVARRRRPYLLVGWLWYLGMLVPVIGLVQVGLQARADRYTYLPLVGVFIALTWGVAEVTHGWRHRKAVLTTLSAITLAGCVVFTAAQVRRWRDSETLLRHTIAVAPHNPIALLNLGSALIEQGRFVEAAERFTEVVRLRPRYAEAHSNLGFALATQGKLDDAMACYRVALQIKPRLAQTHALLANALLAQGRRAEAIAEYETALEINPDWPAALNDLAWILATDADASVRDGPRAVNLAERLCRLTDARDPQFLGTLAAAYAEAGRFADAVQTAEQARTLAAAAGRDDLAQRNEELLQLYRAARPYHEPPAADR